MSHRPTQPTIMFPSVPNSRSRTGTGNTVSGRNDDMEGTAGKVLLTRRRGVRRVAFPILRRKIPWSVFITPCAVANQFPIRPCRIGQLLTRKTCSSPPQIWVPNSIGDSTPRLANEPEHRILPRRHRPTSRATRQSGRRQDRWQDRRKQTDRSHPGP